MKESELRALLHRAGDELPDPDVAEDTWSRGRLARRQRWTARVVGALVSASVVGVLGVQVTGWSEEVLRGTVEVTGGAGDGPVQRLEPPASVLELSRLPDPARTSGWPDLLTGSTLLHQGQQVWADVYTGCLESRGYAVSRDGTALSVTFPDGKQDGDYRRDTQACRAELATDTPTSVPPRSDIDKEARAALTGRYFQYYWAQGCLVDAGLPTSPTMLAEEFIAGLGQTQLPPWHPYQEAAREGRYAEAREACPIQVAP